MEFRTIKQDGIVEDEIKKSRFICHIKRVTTEEEARDFITSIKKNIIRQPIIAPLLLLVKKEKSNVQAMMANPAALLAFRCWAF